MRRAAKVVLSLLRAATLALSRAEILRMCEITGLDRVSPLDGTPLVPVRFANGVHEPLWECINVGYGGGCGRVHIATLGAGYDRGSPDGASAKASPRIRSRQPARNERKPAATTQPNSANDALVPDIPTC